ncbi:hypothetical protein Hanom_Chr02g00151011 [Helianthus anomalus]
MCLTICHNFLFIESKSIPLSFASILVHAKVDVAMLVALCKGLRRAAAQQNFLVLELHWCIHVGQFLLLLNSPSHKTPHLKWVYVFLQPVSNYVRVKMGSFKNHFKWFGSKRVGS